ncbi:MAG: SDR family oxidoreductase [Geodermatophilaceae bacterium]|nr:SDR family oxidoreductase [Geodermatophilaceae bacterium]
MSEESPVALITGAGRGIGAAIAQSLSASGHRVVLTARSTEELEAVAASLPGEAICIAADLTDSGAVDRVFAAAEDAFGRIDVLVANAGAAMSAPVHKTTDADWARMLDLNLTAPFRCIRRAVPGMKERGYGRIVVIASAAAKRGEPLIAAYTASKHGVLGLVRSVAAELAQTGITVNAICPGYVDTPMTDGSIANVVAHTGRDAAAVRAYFANQQPTGRLITVAEVATAVQFCLDSPSVSGQGIEVDGGAVQS